MYVNFRKMDVTGNCLIKQIKAAPPKDTYHTFSLTGGA